MKTTVYPVSRKTKLLSAIVILLLCTTSCNQTSSPEGRMTLKNEVLQTQIDELSAQQKSMSDSITALRHDLQQLKSK